MWLVAGFSPTSQRYLWLSGDAVELHLPCVCSTQVILCAFSFIISIYKTSQPSFILRSSRFSSVRVIQNALSLTLCIWEPPEYAWTNFLFPVRSPASCQNNLKHPEGSSGPRNPFLEKTEIIHVLNFKGILLKKWSWQNKFDHSILYQED